MRHRVTIQAMTRIADGIGGYSESWAPIATVWASVDKPSGKIVAFAGQLDAVVTAEIRTRYRADIAAQMRLVHGGITYRIEAALPDNRRTQLQLLCSSVEHP